MENFPYTHVIWDFNGTLYDDLDATVRAINRLLTAHGLKPFTSRTDYRAAFGFPIEDYYARIGFDFSVTPYQALAHEWVSYYREEEKEAKVNAEAPEAWRFFNSLGCRQIILSATESEMLKGQVEALGLTPYFSEVLGKDTVYASGKEEIAAAFRARNPEAKILMLGDTDHDAAVAKRIGADCILFSCGHQPKSVLEKCGILFVADTFSDVAKESFWGAEPRKNNLERNN